MTDTPELTPINPPPDQSPISKLADAINRLAAALISYRQYVPTILRDAAIAGTFIAAVWGGCNSKKGVDVGEQTKNVATNTNETQKAVAKGTKELVVNQIGDNAPAVKELEATTQESK